MVQMTLGIDLGGSSSKATLIDENGTVIATASKEYASYSPRPGWLEQDADELVDAVIYNIRACLSTSGVNPAQIAAVAVDAATHMAVLCDGQDRPVRRFIHWSDARSSPQAGVLRETQGALLPVVHTTVRFSSSDTTMLAVVWSPTRPP